MVRSRPNRSAPLLLLVMLVAAPAQAQDLDEALGFIEETIGEEAIEGYDAKPARHDALGMLNARDVRVGKPLDAYSCWDSPIDGGPTVMRTSGEQGWATRACHELQFRGDAVQGYKSLGDVQLKPREVAAVIAPAARRWNVPPSLLHAIIRFSSGFRPGVVSNAGHKGLMQLREDNLEAVGITRYGDLLDPANNVMIGAEYFARLTVRAGGYMATLTAWHEGLGTLVKDGWNGNDPKTLWFVREVDRLYYAHGRANRFPNEIAAETMTFIWNWME